MELFSCFRFRILHDSVKKGWYYQLYSGNGLILLHQTDELFDSEGTARYAAIGHISLLEKAANTIEQ